MMITQTNQDITLTPWRALFWEPVSGTGERLMVGVVFRFDGVWRCDRILRDDVLTSLYGNSANSARNLIDFGLSLFLAAANAGGIEDLSVQMAGLIPGPNKATHANSPSELLRTAALMYSSLARSDIFDEQEESDAPQAEEVSRHFSTEVRDTVAESRLDLLRFFGAGGRLIDGGAIVKFGFFSMSAIMHFSVIHPVRQNASVKDARAKLWELSRAAEISGIRNAALITASPRMDDPTLGSRQIDQIKRNRESIEKEADAASMKLHAVTSVREAANIVIEMAAAA